MHIIIWRIVGGAAKAPWSNRGASVVARGTTMVASRSLRRALAPRAIRQIVTGPDWWAQKTEGKAPTTSEELLRVLGCLEWESGGISKDGTSKKDGEESPAHSVLGVIVLEYEIWWTILATEESTITTKTYRTSEIRLRSQIMHLVCIFSKQYLADLHNRWTGKLLHYTQKTELLPQLVHSGALEI